MYLIEYMYLFIVIHWTMMFPEGFFLIVALIPHVSREQVQVIFWILFTYITIRGRYW